MLVTMTETRLAAVDGVNLVQLEEGGTYDLPAPLAARYVDGDLAYAAASPASEPDPVEETADASKDAGAAEENKSNPRRRRPAAATRRRRTKDA